MQSRLQFVLSGLIIFTSGPGCMSNADPASHAKADKAWKVDEVEQDKGTKKVDDDSEQTSEEGIIHRAGWLDVSGGGKRYHGIYLQIRDNGRVIEASGVVLMPWDDRPAVSLVYHDNA